MRTPLIAGNWKMNGDRAMAQSLSAGVVAGAAGLARVEMAVCPPFTLLGVVSTALTGSGIALGAQDMDANEAGAFTGQVSARMLLEWGCRYVLIGHSERRTRYQETDEEVASKAEQAVASGLTAILCVGETAAQRQSGDTAEVVSRQIQAVLDRVGIAGFADIVIAYEPVWAIGTGLTATPEQAQAVHHYIRQQLDSLDKNIAERTRILYGGSMRGDNAAQLIAQPDIDGGLIGGASLNAEDFLAIGTAANRNPI